MGSYKDQGEDIIAREEAIGTVLKLVAEVSVNGKKVGNTLPDILRRTEKKEEEDDEGDDEEDEGRKRGGRKEEKRRERIRTSEVKPAILMNCFSRKSSWD